MINRRDLIAGAASLASAGALASTLPPMLSQNQAGIGTPGIRSAPAHPLTLQSGELSVVFDPQHGLPYSYTYKGRKLWGELAGVAVGMIICRLTPREYHTVLVEALTFRQADSELRFTFQASFAGRPVAGFTLRYAIEPTAVMVTLDSVEESAGFELIEVALPQLMTVREEDGPAWMAEGRHGGSFVRLEAAKAFRFPDDEYFGRISTELPLGLVGQGGVGCVMEVTAFHDGTETEIQGAPGHRSASLGTVMTHRVHGGRCYNMNDGGPPVCGNPATLNLFIEQHPLTRFDFFECMDEHAQPWFEGAKIVRARIPASPTAYFSDRFLYIVAGKRKMDAEPKTTFAQSRQLIQDVAALTDHGPQTVFISGWGYDGQDTGYPSEDKINSTLGTYEVLRELIESSKKLNANVTLNTNYDDAYKSSPIFNESFIARRPDGAIWKSRSWDLEDSYVVGMAKFMQGGWGPRRIAYTMDRYKIQNSILIDAMSWFAVRNDWDPQNPASGYKNLVDGKYKIIEQFKDGGVAVTSEQMRYPFIGRLALSMDGPRESDCPFGGEAIPLIGTVFRGAAIWGTSNSGRANEPQHQLFWNTRSALWFEANSDRTKLADFYYLVVLPYSKLHNLAVEGYESTGSVRRLLLEQQAEVAMDTAGESYHAKVDGLQIARDNATFCPIDGHRIAFYARTARQLHYPLPSGWGANTLAARKLTLHGRSPWKVQCIAGVVTVDVEANTPIIVYANETTARAADGRAWLP